MQVDVCHAVYRVEYTYKSTSNNILTVIFVHHVPHDVFALVVRILDVLLLERDHKLLKLIHDSFQHHLMPMSIRSRSTPVFQPHLFCHRIHSPRFDTK